MPSSSCMYDVEYTCMRKPIPVIINRNKDDKASTWKVNGIYSLPDCIKSNRCTMVVCPDAFTSKKIPSDTQNDASMARLPITPPAALGIVLQPRPLMRKPINGNNGTK